MSTIWLYAMLLDTFTTYNLFYFIVPLERTVLENHTLLSVSVPEKH